MIARTNERFALVVSAVACCVGSAVACIDPVHDDAVKALGPETKGIPEGDTHRKGQPCRVCHGGIGPGEPEWSVAGTVFETRGSDAGARGVTVLIEDAKGDKRQLDTTAGEGNFHIAKREWDPQFPLKVSISRGAASATMMTQVSREGGCGACHQGKGDDGHMPGVYLNLR